MSAKLHKHVPPVKAPARPDHHTASGAKPEKTVTPAADYEQRTQYRKAIRHAQNSEYTLSRVVGHAISHDKLRQRALRFLLVELAKAGRDTEAEQVLRLITDETTHASSEDALHSMRPKHHI